jgi:probable addiction module antidote protein
MKKHNYKGDLLERLKDKEYALGYLNLCMADDDSGVFLVALHDVIEANSGFKAFAKKTGLSREHMFRMLSKAGNPRLETLRIIAAGLGWRLAFAEPSTRELKHAA